MKYYIVGLLASMLSLNVFAGAGEIYASRCDGHRMRFLVLTGNAAGIEEYYVQAKASIYRFKQESVKTAELVREKEHIVYKGEAYWPSPVSEFCGDFTRFYGGFEQLGNAAKLNVCRNVLTCKKAQSFTRSFEEIVNANKAILQLPPADFKAKMK